MPTRHLRPIPRNRTVESSAARARFDRLAGNRWQLRNTAAVIRVVDRETISLDYPAELTDRLFSTWPDLTSCTPIAARARVLAWWDQEPSAPANATVWQPGERYIRHFRDPKGGLVFVIALYEVDNSGRGVRLRDTREPAEADAWLRGDR